MKAENKNLRTWALLSSFVLSVVLAIFPVASGVIVTVNNTGVPQRYWIQGAFMLLSIAVPAVILARAGIKLSRIGFARAEKGRIKTALYFIPLFAAKAGFLLFGLNEHLQTILALAFFTAAIGLSEEIYFRGLILRKLTACFTVKQAVVLSSAFFALVHASQALSGEGLGMVVLTILNALIFGIVASEIVLLTKSMVPVIIWHILYDFINWIALVQGTAELVVTIIQSVIIVVYAGYLWTQLPDRRETVA